MNYLSIGVIIGYMIILFYFVKDDEYLKMLGLTLLTSIVICQLKNNVEGLENTNTNTNKKDNFGNISAEPAESPAEKAPVNDLIVVEPKISQIDSKLRIGPYDGLCIRGLNNTIKDLSNNVIISNDKLTTYLGVQGPVQNVVSDNSDLSGPTVDGDPNSPQRLFMFANNTSSLNCCPSTYSTSTGCVSSTDKQDDYIRRRGFNNTAKDVV